MFQRSRNGVVRTALHKTALAVGLLYSSVLVAPAVQAAAYPPPRPAGHVRPLSVAEMGRIVGRATTHELSLDGDSGSTYAWEGSYGDANTGNGNKLTSVPLVGWSARGGLPVAFTLFHNSEGNHNSELGQKWSHSFDLYLVENPESGSVTLHWGNDLAYPFTRNIDGTFSAPGGIYDTLVLVSSGVYELTTKSQVTYRFEMVGSVGYECKNIRDRNGNTLTLGYDTTSGLLTSVTDPTNRVLTFGYNASNRISTVTDPLNRQWSIAYNSYTGDLTQVTLPTVGGTTYTLQFGYNSGHDITSYTDARGNASTFAYFSDHSLQSETTPLGFATTYAYTSGQTTITNARGYATIHNYSGGRLSSVKDPLNYTETYGYDSANNKTSVTDRRGQVWTFTYDSRGNVLTKTDSLSHTTTLTYNAKNDPLTVTTSLGYQSAFTYDAAGNLTSMTDPLGHTSTLTVNGDGQVTQASDALSHATTFGYDASGYQTTTTDALNHTSSTVVYDAVGRPTSQSDALGNTVTTAYDALNRVTSVTAPGSRTTTFTYDAAGNKLSQTNPLAKTDTYAYDNDGRVTSHTDPNGHVVVFGYDQNANKTSFTDGRNNVTTYAYTSRDELSSIGYPDSTSQSYTYLATGESWQRTDGRGITVANGYDNAGRLTLVDYPTGTTDTTFGYDNDNRKTGMTDATGTTSYTYDNAGRLTQRAAPAGTVNYAYDDANRQTSRTLVGTGLTTLAYDNAGRLTGVTAPNNENTAYTYDNADRLTQTTYANGSYETRAYDASTADLTQVWHRASGGATTIAKQTYTYNNDGRRASETLADGALLTFGYDNAGQLTDEGRSGGSVSGYSIAYTYDNAGNRASKTLGSTTENYAYDAANKLTSAGGKTYTYDSTGNVKTVASTAGTTTLTWDADSRLTGIAYPNSTTNTFAYNGLAQRVGTTDSRGTLTYTLEDDSVDSAVLKDSAATYTHGLGLVSEVRGSTSKFYHGDALGTTRAMTGSTGSVTDTKSTDAFGNTFTAGSSGTTPTPFGFAGQHGYQSDPDSGLMKLGHRYYDSSVGRFLSRDPIQAGYNWYAYCNNDPVNAVDPQGLMEGHPARVRNNTDDRQWVIVTPRGGDPDPKPTNNLPPRLPVTWELPGGQKVSGYPVYPVDENGNVERYPDGPFKGQPRPDSRKLIVPVAPGQTVGGRGMDVDFMWDKGDWRHIGGGILGFTTTHTWPADDIPPYAPGNSGSRYSSPPGNKSGTGPRPKR